MKLVAVALVLATLAYPCPLPGQEPAPSAHDQYLVRPGDVLHVLVWREADLSGDVTVRLDGVITVPLLGEVKTRGRTPAEIAAEITEGLARYVEAPHVTVAVKLATGARFFVVGQVGKQGEFSLVDRTTVLQAIALAGGFDVFAKRDKILLVRGARGQTGSSQVLRVDYGRIQKGDTSQNYVLEPGDTLVVP
jgi:polysaccharide export outer membrane protein